MLPYMVISFLAALLVGKVQSLENVVEAPLPGYGVDVISWAVETTHGGPTTILNGTIQEVYAQLLDINENYEAEFGSFASRSEISITERASNTWGEIHCREFTAAVTKRIAEGIEYLKGVGGQPVLGPGPGNCVRVSCSYHSAIWWCNDNTFTKVLPGFGLIASAAQEILDNCKFSDTKYVSGQNFLGGARDWNVLVREANC